MANENVKEILTVWMKENGYGGLYVDSGCGCPDCGCLAEDLAPCGEMSFKCKAGHKGPADDMADFTIQAEKPAEYFCTEAESYKDGNDPHCTEARGEGCEHARANDIEWRECGELRIVKPGEAQPERTVEP